MSHRDTQWLRFAVGAERSGWNVRRTASIVRQTRSSCSSSGRPWSVSRMRRPRSWRSWGRRVPRGVSMRMPPVLRSPRITSTHSGWPTQHSFGRVAGASCRTIGDHFLMSGGVGATGTAIGSIVTFSRKGISFSIRYAAIFRSSCSSAKYCPSFTPPFRNRLHKANDPSR
jgi:hypothetical protein